MRYLADTKQPKDPQAIFMGVGSGFDAYVKSEIYSRSHGKTAMKGSFFDFETLFESQVEPHHRDEVLEKATFIWESYKGCYAFDALWADILRSPVAPMMEDRIEGVIEGVPLLGLPDLVYVDGDHKVVCDFKILGSAAKVGGGASPVPGYQMCWDGWNDDKRSKTHGNPHPKYEPFYFNGTEIGKAYLEEFDADWADQMSTYAWLLDSDVCSEDFVVRIESAACRNSNRNGFRVKWATHMNRVSSEHQQGLLDTYQEIWTAIENEHIFTDDTPERSKERQEMLELRAATPKGIHGTMSLNTPDKQAFYKRRKVTK